METDSKDAGDIAFRPCESRDGDFLFALFTGVRAGDFAALNWTPEQLEPLLRVQFALQSQSYAATFPRAVHEIICLAEQPVGRMVTEETGQAVHLVDIALIPACRGRGVGSAALRKLQMQCARLRKPLTLQVARNNRAIQLYERLGFVSGGGTEVYAAMKWNPPA